MQGNDRHAIGGSTASGEDVVDDKLNNSHSLADYLHPHHPFLNEGSAPDSQTDGIRKTNEEAEGELSIPRSIILTRSLDHGFGFTLRHFIVYPPEPSSEVECLEEEVVLFQNRQEPLDTIFVKQVRQGSPAQLAGLKTGDRILSVNEASTLNHSYQEIIAIIQTTHPALRLIVISKENDLLQKVFSSTAHNPESNLNVKSLFHSSVFPSHSPWSSRSSLASLSTMPTTVPYHPATPKPLPAAPPTVRLRPILHSPTQKRKAPVRHAATSNSYHNNSHHESSPMNRTGSGRQTPVSSSQSQGRRKTVSATSKDSMKRPLIIDRKQAVYNIQSSLPFPLQKSASEFNASQNRGHSSERRSKDESTAAPLLCQTKDNGVGPLSVKDASRRDGIYEPVVLKGDTTGEQKRLDKDPDGRLYEVVQTRYINSHMASNDKNESLNRRLDSPLCKSLTEGNIVRRKGCSQTLSPLLMHPPKAAKLEHKMNSGNTSDLSVNRRFSERYSNKENVAKPVNPSISYVQDRSTREAIERIKKNVEKKVEFLSRPNEPLWKHQHKGSGVPKEYFSGPQKLHRANWPPKEAEVPPSPGTIMKALAAEKAKGGRVLLRTKSEVEGPRTVSFPCDNAPSNEKELDFYPLEQRSNSLPSSPTKSSQELAPFQSSPPYSFNPLVGNTVAKPYGKHQPEEISQAAKFKPFVSTLTRIHENIPSPNKYPTPCDSKNDVNAPSTPATTRGSTPSTLTPMGSQTSLTSLNSLSTPTRTVPLVWVGDNDRIRQLQIVSTRAKKFESPNSERDSRKTAFHRFELSRLSQRANAFNVADRKKEFERRESTSTQLRDEPGLSFEFGTSFGNNNQQPKRWKNGCYRRGVPGDPDSSKGGIMKSLSDGGSIFSISKEYLSLPPEPCDPTLVNADPSLIQGSGNRMIPVGGSKIHCEPPDSKQLGSKPLNDTGILSIERDRSHSTCSQTAKFVPLSNDAFGRKTSPLIRQHSFHSIQAHLARAVTSLQQRIGASGDSLSSSGGHSVSASAPNAAAGVIRRNKHLYGDENDRLVRRVSYLKATSGDRVYSDSEIESEDEKTVVPSPVTYAKRILGSQNGCDLPSPASFQSSVTKTGPLHVKLAKIHGKRSGDRSWKSVWAVIRGRALLLYKDKQQDMQTPLVPEDQVTLRGADVAVALDYTKRRHVLRLSTPVGSQFLLQAESDPAMTAWLTSLSAAASQDGDTPAKPVAPIAEPEMLSPDFESSLGGSAATTPTTNASFLGGSNTELPQCSSDASPPSALKNAKKNSSQQKPKSSFADQPSAAKSRKITGESWSSPKSKNWKNKLGRQLRKMQAGPSVSSQSTALPEGASIGVCLENCPLSSENEYVPVLVSLCVGVVESKGLRSQGIYRVPGNRAAVTFLTDVVNRGTNAIDLSDTRWSDVNVISSLLKLFFRKLPDPLITSELYPLFIDASKIDNPQQRLTELKHLVQELPDHHYETLRFLCYHLNNIILHSSDNKMDVRNLAIVFGPTLVRASDDNMAKMVTDMSHQCQIVETLLSHVNWFFSEEESDDPPPIIPPSLNPLGSCINADTPVSSSELEPSSQSLLLSNVEKLEANHKDTKKLIVSSIISAANRRVQKVRKKVEEECSSNNNEVHTHDHGIFRDLCDSVSLNQHKFDENAASKGNQSHGFDRLTGSNRDGRLFSDICDTSFPSDERLSSLSSLSSVNTLPTFSISNDRHINPAAVGCDGVLTTSTTTNSSVNNSNNGGSLFTTCQLSSPSRSEPSHIGEETPIMSYAGLSASTQERIRRFETETRAMLQRDMTSHRRELNKQKIEEELQKAKKDMETEDIFDRMADNPSEVMHIMNDYRRKPNREAVSLPFLRSSASSNIKPCGLTNASLAPSSAMTNAPAKNEKFYSDEQNVNQQQPHNEGSDLMSDITATFEEKMKLLQKSHLLASEREELSRIKERSSSPEDFYRYGKESSRYNNSGGTKCKLYRDPSLHRRRTIQSNDGIAHSASSEALSIPFYDYGGDNDISNTTQSDDIYTSDLSSCSFKEKNEKRTLESLRVETPEGLREKKPKELKRSDTHESISQSPPCQEILTTELTFSNHKDKRDSVKNSAELKSRKHNVRELKEKFEQNSKKTHLVSPILHPTTPTSGYEKPTKKQSRKSRIKRRHTVGGMKDLARVAWLKVIEAAHYGDPQQLNQGCQMSDGTNHLPSWEQLQLFLEALAEGRKLNLDQQTINSWVAREKLENSNQDLESILSLVLPSQQKETLKRRLSVREPAMKPLCPVLESNV